MLIMIFHCQIYFFRRNIASLASMQGADDTDSDGEEGQAFYAGGSERR